MHENASANHGECVMKFKFSLQTVMRQRKILEDLAQKEFSIMQNKLRLENEKLNNLQQARLNAFKKASALNQAGGTLGPALSQIEEFKKGQDVRIERQKKRVLEVEKWVEEKREILRQAALEFKIIEKLREKKLSEHKKEQSIAEQKELDEQNVLRFMPRQEKLK